MNMFVGRPRGNYDRLLDFSRAVSGNLFFVPSTTFLENVISDEAAAETAPDQAPQAGSDLPAQGGSLAIGSLNGKLPHE